MCVYKFTCMCVHTYTHTSCCQKKNGGWRNCVNGVYTTRFLLKNKTEQIKKNLSTREERRVHIKSNNNENRKIIQYKYWEKQ